MLGVSKRLGMQMQDALDRLGIPLTVIWAQNDKMPVQGEIKGSVLYVYDAQPSDALATFTHEVIEFKLRDLTQVYRTLINNLIDGYEKLAYQEKEDFIDFIPRLVEAQKNRSKH